MAEGQDQVIALSATGALGYAPFDDKAFDEGLSKKPDFIGAQSGSNDSGPLYVGAGEPHSPRDFLKHDLDRIITAALQLHIPAIVTGCGGNGTSKQLRWTVDVVKEIAAERGLSFTAAIVDAEPPRDYLEQKLAEGKITRLGFPRDLTVEDIRRSSVITAMMGVEPVIKALDAGADIVLTARACDDATFAGYCIWKGFDPGLTLHMGKILECGCLSADPPNMTETLMGYLHRDHFVIEPANPERRSTVKGVASHTLYERENPLWQPGPGGVNDLSRCSFEQVTDRAVKVSGARWIKDEVYRVKLEGAAWAGYRVVGVLGLRDPILLRQIDSWLERLEARVRSIYPGDYRIVFYQYGRNAVLGRLEPFKDKTPHEIGLMVEVVARDQKVALEACELACHISFSLSYEGQKATAGNLAHANSLDVFIPQHQVCYEFSVDHLLALEDPCECFPMRLERIGG